MRIKVATLSEGAGGLGGASSPHHGPSIPMTWGCVSWASLVRAQITTHRKAETVCTTSRCHAHGSRT